MRYCYASAVNIETDYGHGAVLTIAQTARKVGREKHRFEAFVRFELIGPQFFYAPIDPDYNVLPIIVPHFKRRYADQDWLIYDTKRKFGMHYDRQSGSLQEAVLDLAPGNLPVPAGQICFDHEEEKYRELWKNYFKNANIPARRNMRLHLQHVPRRYWKYLVEKK